MTECLPLNLLNYEVWRGQTHCSANVEVYLEVAWSREGEVISMTLFHDKLLINAHRQFRHMTEDDRCPRCGSVVESSTHVVRDWNKFFSKNIQRRVEFNMKYDLSTT